MWLTNSPPPLVLKVLILVLNWFSTRDLKWTNTLKTSDFCLSKNSHVKQVKSSTNITENLWPNTETEGAGPQTSKWINSKVKVVLDTGVGKAVLCNLALIQETHCEQMSLEEEIETEGTSCKVECKIFEQGCLSLWCQSKAWAETAAKHLELKEDKDEDELEASNGIG